jgi:serine/threonine protein kinase
MVDSTEIWAALQVKVPSGELAFDSKKLIGRGASCTVYRAELHGVMCAIKVLSSSFVAKGGKVEKQFISEIDVLASFRDENICRLYASSTNGDHRCVVLELMDISLEKRLMDPEYPPPLSWEQRAHIALCMFRGVLALHSRRPVQIHKDIKTSNILLNGFKTSAVYRSCSAKIADFGTTRAFDHHASISTVRPHNSILPLLELHMRTCPTHCCGEAEKDTSAAAAASGGGIQIFPRQWGVLPIQPEFYCHHRCLLQLLPVAPPAAGLLVSGCHY